MARSDSSPSWVLVVLAAIGVVAIFLFFMAVATSPAYSRDGDVIPRVPRLGFRTTVKGCALGIFPGELWYDSHGEPRCQ